MWQPSSYEDLLLNEYLKKNPGALFLEVPVSVISDPDQARRIDGVLIPGEATEIFPHGSYSKEDLQERLKGRTVHLLEAKNVLERYVVGQVLVGAMLLEKVFEPAEVVKVAVCGRGNPDIEYFCEQNQIKVALFPLSNKRSGRTNVNKGKLKSGVVDERKAPDAQKRKAFLAGWSDAVKGKLYESINTKKTHANMGNMFGWIYGDKPKEFRVATWQYYIKNTESDQWKKQNN